MQSQRALQGQIYVSDVCWGHPICQLQRDFCARPARVATCRLCASARACSHVCWGLHVSALVSPPHHEHWGGGESRTQPSAPTVSVPSPKFHPHPAVHHPPHPASSAIPRPAQLPEGGSLPLLWALPSSSLPFPLPLCLGVTSFHPLRSPGLLCFMRTLLTTPSLHLHGSYFCFGLLLAPTGPPCLPQ